MQAHHATERVRRSPGFRPRPQNPPPPRRSQAAAAPPSSARNRRRAIQSAADAVSEALLPRHTAPSPPPSPHPSHTRTTDVSATPHPRSGRNLLHWPRSSPSRRPVAPSRMQRRHIPVLDSGQRAPGDRIVGIAPRSPRLLQCRTEDPSQQHQKGAQYPHLTASRAAGPFQLASGPAWHDFKSGRAPRQQDCFDRGGLQGSIIGKTLRTTIGACGHFTSAISVIPLYFTA